ncbi:kinase-like protein [Imleria badia]|nr:kinase-like protein [Imleria badia]
MRDDAEFHPPPTYETAVSTSEDFVRQGGSPIELVDLAPSERWELDRVRGIPLDERVKRHKMRTETTVPVPPDPPIPHRARLASEPTVSRGPGSQARFLASQRSLRIPESRDHHQDDRNQDNDSNSDLNTPPTPKHHRMPSIPGSPSQFFQSHSHSLQPSAPVISLLRNPIPFFKSTPPLLNLSASHHGTPHRTLAKLFHRKSKERASSALEDWEVLERAGSGESSIDGFLPPPSPPATPQNTMMRQLPKLTAADVVSPPLVARHVRRHTTSSGGQMSALSAPVAPISVPWKSSSTISLSQNPIAGEDAPVAIQVLANREVASESPTNPASKTLALPAKRSSCAPTAPSTLLTTSQLDLQYSSTLTGDTDPSSPTCPIVPSSLPSTSPLAMEPRYETSTLGENIPPPPDLTPYIKKADDQYVAGGGFGDVYRRRYFGDSPKEVAVKAFRFTFAIDGDTSDRSTKMLRRELGIWRRLDHKNVVPFLGIAYGFGMRDAMSLVSLWMPNESLYRFLAKHDDNLGLGHRLRFLLDIANGLHYLHTFSIVHGDLNSNNVLLDADYTARLTDFGYASLVGNIPEALMYLQRSTARPGALRWVAPEQIKSEDPFNRTPKSDIYSFGCVALQASSFDANVKSTLIFSQVLSGKQPWSEVGGDLAVIVELLKGHKPGRPTSRAINDAHWIFIQDCWSPIEERPTAELMIVAIQRFLGYCPRPLPLCDLLPSWPSHVHP